MIKMMSIVVYVLITTILICLLCHAGELAILVTSKFLVKIKNVLAILVIMLLLLLISQVLDVCQIVLFMIMLLLMK